MRSVTVQQAKTQLSRLLREVEQGEEIEIRRGTVPVAMLVARPAGADGFVALRDRFAGQVEIAEDFDELDEDEARALGMID